MRLEYIRKLIRGLKDFDKNMFRQIRKPKCWKDNRFIYCFCGKCEPDGYPLPSDLLTPKEE